jgi:hypothetical protein
LSRHVARTQEVPLVAKLCACIREVTGPNLDQDTRYPEGLISLCVVFLRYLTFKSLAVSLRTTRFNIQNFYMVLALR